MVAVNLFTSAQGPLSDALILSEMQGNMSRYGQLRLWGSVGYVLMTAASGLVLDRTGIGLMPWVGAAILGAVLLVSLKLYQTPRPIAERKQASVLNVLFRYDVMVFMISGCLMLAAHSALYAFYSLYLSEPTAAFSLIFPAIPACIKTPAMLIRMIIPRSFHAT